MFHSFSHAEQPELAAVIGRNALPPWGHPAVKEHPAIRVNRREGFIVTENFPFSFTTQASLSLVCRNTRWERGYASM